MRKNFKRSKKAMVTLIAVVAAVCVWAFDNAQNRGAAKEISGLCSRVVDGDSLYIKGYGKQIRLWGVDAPETNEAGYSLAKNKLARLAKNRWLSCEIKDVDKYGRTVARCFPVNAEKQRLEREEINRALINSGVAKEYCFFSRGFYGRCPAR